MRVDFYHLTRSGPEGIVSALAEKLLTGGERLLIVADDAASLEKLDNALWVAKPESFLPHVMAGGEGNEDATEPVLLGAVPEAANGARNILIADGRWRDAALDFERAFFLFDAATIEAARSAWKALAGQGGVERHYWKQDERGRWAEGP